MGGPHEAFQNVLADLLLWVVVVIAREPGVKAEDPREKRALKRWDFMEIYPLVNVYITMENHHF